MERYSARTIDELGRLVIHSELRQKLNLEMGDKVSLKIIDTIIILRRAEGSSDKDSSCVYCPINELGMIELPIALRQAMDWKEKDKVALYQTDNIIILKRA